MRRFEGQRVIVTGGAMGIGRATVERFAREGAAVVLTDRRADLATSVAEKLIRKSLRDEDHRRVVADALARLGR